MDGTSYMRNSVKLVIDAYDGSLTAYVSAPADPLIRTWARIFPGIFVPLDSMPADLRAHIRYPDDIYRIQTGLYTTYHMDAPEDFYHREDQWQIPEVTKADESVPFMRHIIMRLPEESKAEFIYMVPFTPRGKENLAAWMVARNDGDVYGKLLVYRLSRQSLVFGPRQIENRINQNTEVARQVSLWDQRGSQVIRGDLLVIPIEESLVYVQPLYLQAEGGRIPELKRVIVAYQNRVVMQETLEAGSGRAVRRRGGAGPRASAGGRCPRGSGAEPATSRHGRPGTDRRGMAPVPGRAGGQSAGGLGPLRRGVPAAGRGARAARGRDVGTVREKALRCRDLAAPHDHVNLLCRLSPQPERRMTVRLTIGRRGLGPDHEHVTPRGLREPELTTGIRSCPGDHFEAPRRLGGSGVEETSLRPRPHLGHDKRNDHGPRRPLGSVAGPIESHDPQLHDHSGERATGFQPLPGHRADPDPPAVRCLHGLRRGLLTVTPSGPGREDLARHPARGVGIHPNVAGVGARFRPRRAGSERHRERLAEATKSSHARQSEALLVAPEDRAARSVRRTEPNGRMARRGRAAQIDTACRQAYP